MSKNGYHWMDRSSAARPYQLRPVQAQWSSEEPRMENPWAEEFTDADALDAEIPLEPEVWRNLENTVTNPLRKNPQPTAHPILGPRYAEEQAALDRYVLRERWRSKEVRRRLQEAWTQEEIAALSDMWWFWGRKGFL